LAEDGILPIQMRGGSKEDKELAPIGTGTFVGHTYDATSVVAQRWTYFVVEEGAVYGGTDFRTGSGR
ncbi:MAG: hypothetical protein Q9204_004476, partial [Flavoplaca sp. TL-2023a]